MLFHLNSTQTFSAQKLHKNSTLDYYASVRESIVFLFFREDEKYFFFGRFTMVSSSSREPVGSCCCCNRFNTFISSQLTWSKLLSWSYRSWRFDVCRWYFIFRCYSRRILFTNSTSRRHRQSIGKIKLKRMALGNLRAVKSSLDCELAWRFARLLSRSSVVVPIERFSIDKLYFFIAHTLDRVWFWMIFNPLSTKLSACSIWRSAVLRQDQAPKEEEDDDSGEDFQWKREFLALLRGI